MPHLSHLTSCTPIKSNSYLTNSLAAAVSVTALYRHLTFHISKFMFLFCCVGRTEDWIQVRDKCSRIITNQFLQWGVVNTLPNLQTTPCWLSATAYWVHLQLPSILEAVPPSIPEDTPCCGDTDPLITGQLYTRNYILQTKKFKWEVLVFFSKQFTITYHNPW